MTTFVRMTELAEEAEACAQRIEASLDLTLSEGKKMLRFLGQPPAQEDLPGKVKSVCETVAKFTSMLKGAIADVQRYESRRAAESSNPEPSGKLSSFGFTRRRRTHDRSSGSEAKILHKKLARDCIERALWKACMPCEAALPPLTLEPVREEPEKVPTTPNTEPTMGSFHIGDDEGEFVTPEYEMSLSMSSLPALGTSFGQS